MEGTRRQAGESGSGGEVEGTTGDERRPRNAGTLGVREEPARVQEEGPCRGAGGGTRWGAGGGTPPGLTGTVWGRGRQGLKTLSGRP